MNPAKKVLFNTGLIYAKTLVTIVVALYSTRILLINLGVKDFGLFNVIGGLISMLSFLNAAMTVSTQRFISFNIGSGDIDKIKKIFANSIILHFLIGIALVVIFEIIGVYFLNYSLKIDSERLLTANLVFHLVVISTFVTVISVPYDAIINAHENMGFLAITGILESILKLLFALFLFTTTHDKLLVYGFLIMIGTILIRIIKRVYVKRNYKESDVSYRGEYDKQLIKTLSSFAGWNLFGSFSYIARNEGMAILLNIFYSTVVNAAFGIANQVAGQLNFFCSAMLQAINPQIMKSEGGLDRARMFNLSMIACKLGFLLLAFIAIPCIAEMNSILSVWLKVVPDYSRMFCILILIAGMVNQLTIGLDSAIQATGAIKNYMIVGGCLKLLIVPVAYVMLRNNSNIYLIFALYSILEGAGGAVRLFILKRQAQFSIQEYVNTVLAKVLPVAIISSVISYLMVNFIHFSYRWLFSIPMSMLIFICLAYFISLSKSEKSQVSSMIIILKKKINFRSIS